jgi:hypothetical protein
MIEDDEPYKGLKLDMLDLVDMKDPMLFGVLTDEQAGLLVHKFVNGLKADAEKFRWALDHKIQRSKGCKVCFYTGFQMTFSGFGTQLDPSRHCTYCEKNADG